MKPINKEEFQNLEKLISDLESFPDSIRMFNALHNFCFDVLKKNGERVQLGRKYNSILEKKTVAMCYSKIQDKDSIYINYTSGESYKNLDLMRKRGCQTQKMMENKDRIARLSMGIRFRDAFKGLFTYEPFVLSVYDGKKFKTTNY